MQKVCDHCQKACMPIACSNNPDASEWYCKPCHESYKMDLEVAMQIIQHEKSLHSR